jgi:hypothetical protein
MPDAEYASCDINRAIDGINLLTPSPPLAAPCPSANAPFQLNLPKPALEIARKFLELLSLKHDKIGQNLERASAWDFIRARML